jgi:hypothetical protein
MKLNMVMYAIRMLTLRLALMLRAMKILMLV